MKCFGPETHITSVVPMALGMVPPSTPIARTVSDKEEPSEAEKALGVGGANPMVDTSPFAPLASEEQLAAEAATIAVGTLFYLYQALGMSAWVDMHQDQVKAGPCTTKDSELPQTQVTHCNTECGASSRFKA